MRTFLCVVTAAVLVPAVRGQDAKAVIEKAIEAHGGAANLDKYAGGRAKSKGTIVLKGTEFPFTAERVYLLPNRSKTTYQLVIMNVHRTITYVVNGNTVAALAGGLAQEMPKAQVDEVRTGLYVQNVTRLTPLLKDKKYKLAVAEEKSIDGKPAVGVTVSAEEHKDVRLYFDKQTNLLVGLLRMGHDDQGKPAELFDVYSDFREANGIKYPTKTVVKENGNRYLESETTEFKPLEKVDGREFQIGQP
jgi:hypothetical protein